MLKRILLTLILFSGLSAFASENYLNSIVISQNDDKISIVLRSDEIAKVKKEIETPDKIIVTLKGVTQSPEMNTLYQNISDVNGFIIQNEGNNELKLYINAPDIAKADIVFETPNSAPMLVVNKIRNEKAAWCIISFILLGLIMRSAKNKTKPIDATETIKEREKQLYRNFQKEVAAIPSINYKLKSYQHHVLKGETIRSYESRMSAKM